MEVTVMNYELTEKIIQNIKKACSKKKEIKLTIGYTDGIDQVIRIFGEKGEIKGKEKLVYEIGSISKTFTATLLSKAIWENKLSLNDTIDKHIGGMINGKYYPRIRRIATHTAGYSSAYPLGRIQYLKLFKDLIFGGGIETNNPLLMDYDKMIKLMNESNLTLDLHCLGMLLLISLVEIIKR